MKYAHLTDLHLSYFTKSSIKAKALKLLTKDSYTHQPDLSSKTMLKLISFIDFLKAETIQYLFITGDILPTFAHPEKDKQIIESFLELLDYHNLLSKTHIVSGNHDTRLYGNFGNIMDADYRFLNHNPYYLFLLNSCEKSIGLDDGGFSDMQMDFVESHLRYLKDGFVFILMHHPPNGINGSNQSVLSTIIKSASSPELTAIYEVQKYIRSRLKNWGNLYNLLCHYSEQNNLKVRILCGHKHQHIFKSLTDRITIEMRSRFKSYKKSEFYKLTGTF